MIILEQVLVNMICMNNLFINLLEACHKDKFEDYEILCNAVEGFIDENSINEDFNPWSFNYILFDELNVVESKHFFETLSQFVKMINDKMTLKLIVE